MRAAPEEDGLDEASLAAWLAGVARRDTDALAVLYGQTSGRLFAVLLRLLRRRDLAEEVLHDVYLKVWDRAGSYQPERGAPMAWLVAVARHAALDHLRRQRRAPEEGLPPGHLELPDPRDAAAGSAARHALQACLDQLEPEPRRCVLLAYQGGFTYEELARRFDRPPNTVKSWVRRSLLRLRRCLEAP
jgi:RNA polymerase sigma-70 factor (ECF subfamily)